MRRDNVEVHVFSNRDLGEVLRAHPGTSAEIEAPDGIEGLRALDGGRGFQVGTHGSASPDGRSSEPYLQADPASDLDTFVFEPGEIEALQEVGAFTRWHTIEATDAELTARVVCALARREPLAIHNDWGGVMAGEAFGALDQAAQVRFLQAKHEDDDRLDEQETQSRFAG